MQFWGLCLHEKLAAGHPGCGIFRESSGIENGWILLKHVDTPSDMVLLILLSFSSLFRCHQRLKQQELPSEFTFQPERGNANFILSCSPLFRIDENISDMCERLSNSDNQRRLCIQQQITVWSSACSWIGDGIAGILRSEIRDSLVSNECFLGWHACGFLLQDNYYSQFAFHPHIDETSRLLGRNPSIETLYSVSRFIQHDFV